MSLDETKVSDRLLAGTSWNDLPDVSLVLDIYLRVACAFLYRAFPRMSVAPIHRLLRYLTRSCLPSPAAACYM